MNNLGEMWTRRRARIIAMRAFGDKQFGSLIRGYMERTHFFDPAVWWDQNRPGFAYVNKQSMGTPLRHLGNVTPECHGNRNWRWMYMERSRVRYGWYTNDEGESWTDGTGLVWGVVYALTGKRGVTRYVAGYQFGGVDDGPVLDLSRIFEGISCYGDQRSHEEGREAARYADELARCAAEEEQEYRRLEEAS